MKTIAFILLFLTATTQTTQTQTNPLSWTYCTTPTNGACTFDYRPVCGVKTTGLPQTYGNACGACNTLGVVAYRQGECKAVADDCSTERTNCKVIRMMQIASCGFEKEKEFVAVEWQICCLGDSYDFVIPGECPTLPGETRCKEERGQGCTKELKEVCALRQDESRVTYGNGCMACADKSVVSYVSASCKPGAVWCKLSDRNQPCNRMLMWVCGTKADGSWADFSNGCVACSDFSVMSYVNGRCPQNNTGNNTNTTSKYILCSNQQQQQQRQCRPNNSLVCAIPKKGFPITLTNHCSVCRPRSEYFAYSKGACQVTTCPRKRTDCSNIRIAFNPSCVFYRNGTYENAGNGVCCIGTTFVRVLKGRCPQ